MFVLCMLFFVHPSLRFIYSGVAEWRSKHGSFYTESHQCYKCCWPIWLHTHIWTEATQCLWDVQVQLGVWSQWERECVCMRKTEKETLNVFFMFRVQTITTTLDFYIVCLKKKRVVLTCTKKKNHIMLWCCYAVAEVFWVVRVLLYGC